MANEQQNTAAAEAQAQVKESEVRRQKLAALRERGIDPFGAAFNASHTTSQVLAEFDSWPEEQEVQFILTYSDEHSERAQLIHHVPCARADEPDESGEKGV